MANIQDNIAEVVQDLTKKIEDLSLVGIDETGDNLAKINEVKNKALNVLNEALRRINQLDVEDNDFDELQKAIDVVRVKSMQLYENTINKINEIIQTKQETNEVVENKTDLSLNEKAINTLKDLFK